MKLSENNGTNKYVIKLVESKHLSYELIYSLNLVELEIVQIYIETYLKTELIRSSKSLAGALKLFHKKFDNSLQLYINYQELNNLIIKNWYSLPLIVKFLDWLGLTRCFTQLDVTSAFYQMGSRKEMNKIRSLNPVTGIFSTK